VSGVLSVLGTGGKNKMRVISVALPALTWKSARNAARAEFVFTDIPLVMLAASNRESFRIEDFSGLQEAPNNYK
jgi:hypothetical protein